jgi:hypothetical protein
MSQRPRHIGIGAITGLGAQPRILPRRGAGIGDMFDPTTLTEAQKNLTAAGYQGVTCRTERVALPMTDPATGKNYYDQQVCSAPGYIGGFDANLVANASTLAHPGYGVDLAAERAYLTSQGGGHSHSYFEDFTGPTVQVLAQTDTSGKLVNGIPAPTAVKDFNVYTRQLDTAAAKRDTAGASGAGAATTAASQTATTPAGQDKAAPPPKGGFLDELKSIDPIWLIGGAALILALVMMNKGK